MMNESYSWEWRQFFLWLKKKTPRISRIYTFSMSNVIFCIPGKGHFICGKRSFFLNKITMMGFQTFQDTEVIVFKKKKRKTNQKIVVFILWGWSLLPTRDSQKGSSPPQSQTTVCTGRRRLMESIWKRLLIIADPTVANIREYDGGFSWVFALPTPLKGIMRVTTFEWWCCCWSIIGKPWFNW